MFSLSYTMSVVATRSTKDHQQSQHTVDMVHKTFTEPKLFVFEGIAYANYLEYCSAKQARNQRCLEALGLAQGFSLLKSPPTRVNKSTTTTTRKKYVLSKPRRVSDRVRGLRTAQELDTVKERHSIVRRPIRIRRSIQHQPAVEVNVLTNEQRASLCPGPDWWHEMDEFLRTVPHGRTNRPSSSDNARHVMRQVALLVSGSGITYHHWKAGVCFKSQVQVSLADDLDMLYEEAQAFQNKHGQDLGNGWLLLHPIKKLKLFQEYYFNSVNKR